MSLNFNLLDVIEKKTLDEILHGFTEVSGIASFIVNPNGLPVSSEHRWTTLCSDYCRSTEEGRQRCYKSDRYGGEMSAKLKKRFIYPCLNAGLIDCTSPIIVGKYHIGTVMCGQILYKPMDENLAIEHARKIGISDVTGYLKAIEKIPIISHERLNSIVGFMEVVTGTISELAWNKYMFSRQSRRYIANLVNRVSDSIVSIDGEGKISMVNEAFGKIVGHGKERIIGQPFSRYISDDASIESYDESLKEASQKGQARVSLNIFNAMNQSTPVHAAIAETRDEDRNPGYVAILRDMSEEMKIAKLKEDLTGMMTHDLGNPILSIQKAMQLLSSKFLGPLNQGQEEIIGLTVGTCQQLYRMVMDYLDIYRHENGQFLLRKHMLDMRDIVHESIKQIKILAEEKGVSIWYDSPSIPLYLMGDQTRLLRICLNLLGNAIRYSPEQGEIAVLTMLVDRDDEVMHEAAIHPGNDSHGHASRLNHQYILTTISDRGSGIDEEFHKAIFDKFFTLKEEKREKRAGVGLGLAFCKLAVEAHKGFIWVKSPIDVDENCGCRLHFALPAEDKIHLDPFKIIC